MQAKDRLGLHSYNAQPGVGVPNKPKFVVLLIF